MSAVRENLLIEPHTRGTTSSTKWTIPLIYRGNQMDLSLTIALRLSLACWFCFCPFFILLKRMMAMMTRMTTMTTKPVNKMVGVNISANKGTLVLNEVVEAGWEVLFFGVIHDFILCIFQHLRQFWSIKTRIKEIWDLSFGGKTRPKCKISNGWETIFFWFDVI